jgi:hypothetical protein
MSLAGVAVVVFFAFFATSAAAQAQAAAPDDGQAATASPPQPTTERYRDGMVIWETPPGDQVPFLLKFNINTQLRYLNTQNSEEEFTDHLGVTREVHERNDITVNRAMFISGATCSIRGSDTASPSGRPAWRRVDRGRQQRRVAFNKALTVMAGYTGVPAAARWSTRSRSLRRPTGAWPTTSSARVHAGAPGPRRARRRRELSGLCRQRPQHPEHLGE